MGFLEKGIVSEARVGQNQTGRSAPPVVELTKLPGRDQGVGADAGEERGNGDGRRVHVMPVHRLGQAEELLRGPRVGEPPAVVPQVGFHTRIRHARSVRKATAELLFGAIGRERNSARQLQALGLVATSLAESDNPPLQVAEADRHRVTPGGRADHDDLTHPLRKPRGERQRDHPAVRGTHDSVQGGDADLLAGGDNGRRLVDRRDRREGTSRHRSRGLAATAQPVKTEDLILLGVEGLPRTDLRLPPPFRIGPARHITTRRDPAQYDDDRPARSTEPAESDGTGVEPLPAGERQSLLEPDLMGGAGTRAHALTGRPEPGSP